LLLLVLQVVDVAQAQTPTADVVASIVRELLPAAEVRAKYYVPACLLAGVLAMRATDVHKCGACVLQDDEDEMGNSNSNSWGILDQVRRRRRGSKLQQAECQQMCAAPTSPLVCVSVHREPRLLQVAS
jgi:hypothetical protein